MAKRKPKSIARLVEDAACILQRIVRLKAADENGYCACVTCGKIDRWQDLQGGHFISRRFTAHKLLEEQIHPQCPGCNGPKKGNPVAYTLYMLDTFGREWVDNLEATKWDTKKYSRAEITEIIEDLKHYESEVRKTKGL